MADQELPLDDPPENEQKECFSALMLNWNELQPAPTGPLADCEIEADLLGEVVPPRKGGRPAGALNKKTRALADLVLATGQSPGMFLASIYRDKNQPMDRRITAANALMPYTHQKLPTAVDLIANNGVGLTIDLSGFESSGAPGAGDGGQTVTIRQTDTASPTIIDVTSTTEEKQPLSEVEKQKV